MSYLRELLGTWSAPDPKFELALTLWRDYDRRTDEFDLAHGARRNDRGEVGPPHPGYRAASARFAREEHARITNSAAIFGIDRDLMEKAKHSPERWARATNQERGTP